MRMLTAILAFLLIGGCGSDSPTAARPDCDPRYAALEDQFGYGPVCYDTQTERYVSNQNCDCARLEGI